MSTWPDHDQIVAFLTAHLEAGDSYRYQVLGEETSGMLNDILLVGKEAAASVDPWRFLYRQYPRPWR